jgi:hypothetical protein
MPNQKERPTRGSFEKRDAYTINNEEAKRIIKDKLEQIKQNNKNNTEN